MKIYFVSRIDRIDYDEYDGFVVRANSKEEALELCKKETKGWAHYDEQSGYFHELNTEIEEVEMSGGARVILGSFNAG